MRPARRPWTAALPPVTTPTPERPLLTLPEAARALAVSRSTVFELAKRGELPTVRIGSARRVLPDDLADFIARRRVAREGGR